MTLAGLPYVADEILTTKDAMAPLFVCVIGPMLVTMPVWRSAAVGMGKKPALLQHHWYSQRAHQACSCCRR